ncbi:MAG: hypothetical protein KF801_06710 [Cryobacterium sp.]|jgi:hypothetical protein|nr:hypothetical protein [Cryobacterium sp.]
MTEVPHDADEEERTTVTIRRAPKFSVFVAVGALVGFLATLVLTSLHEADPAVGFAASLGFFSLFGVPIGGILGAVVAIVLDYRASRRAATVIAGKLEVRADDEPDGVGDNAAQDNPTHDSSSDNSAQRSDG